MPNYNLHTTREYKSTHFQAQQTFLQMWGLHQTWEHPSNKLSCINTKDDEKEDKINRMKWNKNGKTLQRREKETTAQPKSICSSKWLIHQFSVVITNHNQQQQFPSPHDLDHLTLETSVWHCDEIVFSTKSCRLCCLKTGNRPGMPYLIFNKVLKNPSLK